MSAPRKVGRPTIYSQAIADEIYLRIAEGESVRRSCKDAQMPVRSVLYNWLETNPEFRELYALARELQVEGYADEIIDIADDASKDWVERQGPHGEIAVVFDPEQIKRDRLRVNARMDLGQTDAPKIWPQSLPRSGAFARADDAGRRQAKGHTPENDPLAKAIAAWRKIAGAKP